MTADRATAIVVTFQSAELISRCLRSLRAADIDVIIVDNASGDGTVANVRREFPEMTLLANTSNVGFGAAINQALPLVQGEIVLLVNPDCVVPPSTVAGLVAHLDANPTVAVVGPRLVDPTGRVAISAHPFETLGSVVASRFGGELLPVVLRRVLSGSRRRASYDACTTSVRPVAVDWLSGACIAVRTAVLREIGGMDERYFLYYEDEELCWQVRRRGAEVVHLPTITAEHVGGASSTVGTTWPHLYRSMLVFFALHRSGFIAIRLTILLRCGVGLATSSLRRLLGGDDAAARTRAWRKVATIALTSKKRELVHRRPRNGRPLRVLLTAVGQRTEHWTELFEELARRSDLDLTVVVADVSPQTVVELRRGFGNAARARLHHLPHVFSEKASGHMASIAFRPGALRRLALDPPDVMHVIGEASYLSTYQLMRWRARRCPSTPVAHYAAQNIVIRFPIPFRWIERHTYRHVNHMLPITPAALGVLRSKGYGGPATVIPLGVDSQLFTPSAPAVERDFTIGFIGRLEAHKGVDLFLRAGRRLQCKVVVVGDGALADLVESESRARPGSVTRHPWAAHCDLPELIATMDVLVLPAIEIVQRNVLPWIGIPLREQFGRVLVEAMACGVPVVGSDVGEIAHVIGPAGLVFPQGDLERLVDCLTQLRDDPALSRRLADDGVARARAEFNWQRIAGDMLSTWNALDDNDVSQGPSESLAPRQEMVNSE